MALSTKAGNFALNTSTGNQAVTGIGFQPEIVLLFGSMNTADGVVVDFNLVIGAATSSTARGHVSINDEDGQGTSDSSRTIFTNSCLRMLAPGSASSYLVIADFVSMNADGFTINISTAPGSAYRIGYLALAGSDLTSVKVGSFTTPVSTGNNATTGVGFQPDAVLLFSNGDVLETDTNSVAFGFGFAVSASERAWTSLATPRSKVTTETYRRQGTDGCIAYLDHDGSSLEVHADFVSFDADGFTLNFDTTTSGDGVIYVALKGGQYAVGDLLTRTSTGNFSETGIGFQPSAGIFASFCNPVTGSIIAGLEMSIGLAVSSTERFVVGGVSEDAQGTSDTDQFQDDGLVYQNYDHAQALEGSIDFVSWDGDGFTLNQVDADPTAGNEVIYFVIGADEVAAAGPVYPGRNHPSKNLSLRM